MTIDDDDYHYYYFKDTRTVNKAIMPGKSDRRGDGVDEVVGG